MRLRDWLNGSKFSVTSFAEEVRVQRTMVHQYFTGAVPRLRGFPRVKVITKVAVPARGAYTNIIQRRLDTSEEATAASGNNDSNSDGSKGDPCS